MFNIKDQIFVLEIPKNGSRSLVASVRNKYGKNYIKCEGHHTLEALVDMKDHLVHPQNRPIEPYTFAAVIRNPVDRLSSQVRQAERMKTNITLDAIMEKAWEQSDIVFKPQWHFVQVPTGEDNKPLYAVDLRLWDMKRIELAMRFVAQTCGAGYHMNRSPLGTRFGLQQIMDHKLFDELLDSEHHYKPDLALWIEAQRTNEDGEAV